MTTDAFDAVLGGPGALRSCDVGAARARRLRDRCHAALRAQEVPKNDGVTGVSMWRRVGPAVAGAWCAIYVFETIRRAATFYWS